MLEMNAVPKSRYVPFEVENFTCFGQEGKGWLLLNHVDDWFVFSSETEQVSSRVSVSLRLELKEAFLSSFAFAVPSACAFVFPSAFASVFSLPLSNSFITFVLFLSDGICSYNKAFKVNISPDNCMSSFKN
jgi:hypothetical protein